MEFLRFVAEKIYKNYEKGMENVTIVLPTRRAGLFIKNYLGELAGDTPVCAPQCTTISDLFDSLCDLKAVDEIKAVCMLYDLFCEKMEGYYKEMEAKNISIKRLSLDGFYGWGRQLIADFNNVDKNYKDSAGETIFSNSKEAHEFDLSNIDTEVRERILKLIRGENAHTELDEASFRRHFEVIWESLSSMYKELKEKLEQEGSALEGARNKWVIQHFDEIWPSIEDRTFVFAGFNILLGTEKLLLNKLKDKDNAVFYWEYDKFFDENEKDIHAYKHTRKNLEVFGGEYEDSVSKIPEIELISASSDNAQARYVYTWLKDEKHKPGEKNAVVLCNESMLQPVIFSVPKEMSDNVNITNGFPMKNTQVFAKISSWLHDKKNTGGDFMTILQNLKQMIEEIPQVHVSKPSQDTVDQSEECPTPWYELLARESEYQAHCVIVRFMQLIEDGTLKKAEKLSTLVNLLIHHLSSISIPFHGEPITDTQIIGVLETRTLDFDNVLLLNVEEGVVPRKGHDNSFIPFYLRRYYGLTTNEDQTDVYAYNFFRLLHRAKSVTILYSEAQTAEGQKSMSRFVMQMLVSNIYKKNISRYIFRDSTENKETLTEEERHKRLLKRSKYSSYISKINAEQNDEPKRQPTLSPSAIASFLKCKMYFFLRYILSLKEPETDGNLLKTNELGTLIHESIRAAYKRINNGNECGTVTSTAIDAFIKNPNNFEAAITDAYASMNEDYKARNPESDFEFKQNEHPIENAVARKHLEKVLTNDKALGSFEIVGNEKKCFFKYSSSCINELYIGGSIDRLDIVKVDGQPVVRVVDYKTGSYKAEKMCADSMEKVLEMYSKQTYMLQTMVYTHAYLQELQTAGGAGKGMPIKPMLLFTQKDLSHFDPHLKVNDVQITDFREHDADFIEKLSKLVETILTEEDFEKVPANHDNCSCSFCGYACLCGREYVKPKY